MIFGISGKKGTGKTTLANHLVELLAPHRPVRRVSFADAMRDEIHEHFWIPYSVMAAGKDTKLPLALRGYTSVREIMQWWGSDVRRKADPDYWVEAFRKIPRDPGDLLIVDDVRFENEADEVRVNGGDMDALGRMAFEDLKRFMDHQEFADEYGGRLVRIEPYPGYEAGEDSHPSETTLDNYPFFNKKYSPAFGDLKTLAETIIMDFDLRGAPAVAP